MGVMAKYNAAKEMKLKFLPASAAATGLVP